MENKPTIAIPPQGCESYLTAGKEYEITDWDGKGFYIIDDDLEVLPCVAKRSVHLKRLDWILK